MSKLRLLVVSPTPSHPADQGNSARIQTLGAELMERGLEIEFFYYGMEGLKDAQRAAMTAFWSDFHFMPSLPLPPPSLPNCWGIDDWAHETLCEAVRALHHQRSYDAVLVNYVWMSRVLTYLEGTFRILDTHDLFGDRQAISLAAGLEPRWFFTSLEDENRGFRRADLLIGIQDHETQTIRARVPVQTITVGHLMTPHFLTDFAERAPIAPFGYFGSGNPWNRRCVEALDRALGADTEIDWLLAGSLLREPLRLISAPYLLGTVDEPTQFYDIVDCVINPMMGGTGLKIKTVEALAYGKPVIGTVDAFQGMPTQHRAHGLSSVEECAKTIKLYAADEGFRGEVRLASRILYLEYFAKTAEEITRLRDFVGRASVASFPTGQYDRNARLER
jgi:hypothetical protein